MCLAAIAIGQSQRFPWVLASNRDEYFRRPAMPLAWWRPPGGGEAVLSGRDLAAGGTWLGLNASGRLALLTNVREPLLAPAALPSRGELVLQWLRLQGHGRAEALGPDPAHTLHRLASEARHGFNLFTTHLAEVATSGGLQPCSRWLSNRPEPVQGHVGAGVFGLSNASWDTPWPKVQRLKQRLAEALEARLDDQALLDAAFSALADPVPAADAQLPSTGVPLARERQLSSAFIRIESEQAGTYGTRCSTVVLVEQLDTRRQVRVVERSFDESGAISGQQEKRLDLIAR